MSSKSCAATDDLQTTPSSNHTSDKRTQLLAPICFLSCRFEIRDPGIHVMDGQTLQLPPVVLGAYGRDPAKKTVLVYGHYDVQPALKEDGWATEPFELVENEKGELVGRGSTDDKGPILGWLNAIEAHQKLGLELPVNLRMCFEGTSV